MPLRPIDMQVILPRVQSSKNAKETIVHKEDNAQHQQQMKNIEQADKKRQQVNAFEQKEEEKIKDEKGNEGKDKSKGSSKKKKKKKDKEDESNDDNPKKGLGYHRFDMKV